MIETQGVEDRNLKISAMMFVVTIETFLSTYFLRPVIAFVVFNHQPNFSVAIAATG